MKLEDTNNYEDFELYDEDEELTNNDFFDDYDLDLKLEDEYGDYLL